MFDELLRTQTSTISQPHSSPSVDGPPEGISAEPRRRKKDKVRAAWISFVGRILAQCLGAAATVALGLIFLHQYRAASSVATAPTAPTANAAMTAPPARDRHPGETWLAVLPFEDYSADQTEAYLADAMTESLIATMSRVPGLRIVSRTSSMHYKSANRPVREIARELGVDWIVEGSVFRVSDRVRVVGQLIDATADEHVWAETYERPFKDLLTLQAGLASAIATSVDVALQERQVLLPLSGPSRLPWGSHQTISQLFQATSRAASRP